jgi:hypothetical protein
VAVRFHLDEHIPTHVAAGLRRRNIDVTTSAEAGMIATSDLAQLQSADDAGFLRPHAEGVPHAGIAYCRQQSKSIGEMLRRLILMHDLLAPEEMAGRVEFL